MAILERLQWRTQIKTLAMGKSHSKVSVPVGINGELRDVKFLVSQYALDGRADLPFKSNIDRHLPRGAFAGGPASCQ